MSGLEVRYTWRSRDDVRGLLGDRQLSGSGSEAVRNVDCEHAVASLATSPSMTPIWNSKCDCSNRCRSAPCKERDENTRIQTAFEEGELFGKIRMLQNFLTLPQSTDDALRPRSRTELETLVTELQAQLRKRMATVWQRMATTGSKGAREPVGSVRANFGTLAAIGRWLRCIMCGAVI